VKLSELVAKCAEHGDPVVTVEDSNGFPVDIEDADLGVARFADGSHTTYVCLTPAERED
jgi:hypothetical protein